MVPAQTAPAFHVVRHQNPRQPALPLPESGQYISRGASVSHALSHAASLWDFPQAYGIYPLPPLSLMRDNLTQYKEVIRPYIAEGTYLPLYLSEHVNVFSYTRGRDSLLFLFAEEPEAVSFNI